jgi:hypothetical protein
VIYALLTYSTFYLGNPWSDSAPHVPCTDIVGEPVTDCSAGLASMTYYLHQIPPCTFGSGAVDRPVAYLYTLEFLLRFSPVNLSVAAVK